MKRTALISILIGALGFGGAVADERVAQLLARAETALAAADTPKERLAALGKAAQAQEAALAVLRGDIRVLADRRQALDQDMVAQTRSLRAVLSALERLERSPRAAALAHKGGAVAAARAGMALSAFAPALEDEAARLRVALEEIRALTQRRDVAIAETRASLAVLQGARAEIAQLLNRDRNSRRTPRAVVDALRAETEKLGRSATTLRALSRGLPPAHALGDDGPAPSVLSQKGTLTPPVEGVLSAGFGEKDAEGVEITAPAFAEVYAPWRGVIRFAGQYGEYGGLIILEPEDGVLFVMAGVEDIRHDVGDVVLAGAPLATLGGPEPQAEEFLITTTGGAGALAPETLYIEVRQGGALVDPADWFAFVTKKDDT
ncbi:MAG: murein hydrolase activator EnvC family protein [Pikeienuella sp.]